MPITWDSEKIDRIRVLAGEGKSGRDVAAILSQEWGKPVSEPSVLDAFRRNRKPGEGWQSREKNRIIPTELHGEIIAAAKMGRTGGEIADMFSAKLKKPVSASAVYQVINRKLRKKDREGWRALMKGKAAAKQSPRRIEQRKASGIRPLPPAITRLFCGRGIPLSSARPNQCRWPYENADGEPARCCGRPIVKSKAGYSFCAHHMKIATREPEKQGRAQRRA